jgi:hypothetical protein
MNSPSTNTKKRTKKDRGADFLREIRLLGEQARKFGSINLERLPPMKDVRRTARRLVANAGFDYRKPDDIDVLLWLLDKHLNGQFSPGARRKIPYDDFELVTIVYQISLRTKLTKLGPITTALHDDSHFSGFAKNALHNLLARAIEKAIKGTLEVPKSKVAALNRMLPILRTIHGSIKPRRSLK